MTRMILWSVLALALATSPASATESEAQLVSAKNAGEAKAQITLAKGKVLVNQGAGFVPVAGSESLKLGDKIFVGPEASASITYLADNCIVAAPAGRLLTVDVLSPCQDKSVRIQPAADLPQELPPEARAAVGFPWWLLV